MSLLGKEIELHSNTGNVPIDDEQDDAVDKRKQEPEEVDEPHSSQAVVNQSGEYVEREYDCKLVEETNKERGY
uniref:Uncharacterized protein n=1 Tax=Steinernema glaseri TaxID=37863 RepID=A0A1I8A2Q7_9BILA